MIVCRTCSMGKPDDDYAFRSPGVRSRQCRPCAAAYLMRYKAACATPVGRAKFLAEVASKKAMKAAAAVERKRAFRAEYEKRPKVVAYRTAYKAKPERRAAARASRTNPDRRATRAAYARQKRRVNKAFLINGRMSCLVRSALKRGKEGRSWRAMVDYSLAELVAHLERQFLPRMGWHNAGDWHIDHILPIASFAFDDHLDPEFTRCWALPNLRPLWRTDNIRKSDNLVTLL